MGGYFRDILIAGFLGASIYADAFSKDEEFYAFTRSLNAYRETFSSKNDVLLLDPDSDYFKYLKDGISQQ